MNNSGNHITVPRVTVRLFGTAELFCGQECRELNKTAKKVQKLLEI
jgi:hypothetical protein